MNAHMVCLKIKLPDWLLGFLLKGVPLAPSAPQQTRLMLVWLLLGYPPPKQKGERKERKPTKARSKRGPCWFGSFGWPFGLLERDAGKPPSIEGLGVGGLRDDGPRAQRRAGGRHAPGGAATHPPSFGDVGGVGWGGVGWGDAGDVVHLRGRVGKYNKKCGWEGVENVWSIIKEM